VFPSVHEVAPLFNLFDESLAQLERATRQASRGHFKRPFNPNFDVKEAKESYLVEGELPGFEAKDISIEFLDDGHTLQIKGKYVKETKTGQPTQEAPKAVGDAEASKATEHAPATEQSESSSVKSHQPTVEDDVEEPANASAVTEQPQQETVTESSKAPTQQEQQVAQQEKKDETKHWLSERYTGSFTRSFSFPSKVNQEAVKASLKDGILAITLPFARKPESRRIQIE